ncbi:MULTISPECIES: hypothetical protein [unclassified Chelatococcus]|uniref:hypothetical protein n=1 Tax=unclassified Chelatococcus TaxID=2638111 RepID=UPI001BCB7C80|nr:MULTISPECIES: hypothetical protein [unclassified Chelatococcus]MBS7701497.1 hypothetical protein [Chelatococcus sp. YT9]MBX3559227.1 hypothetical protein [Chelatococcus sp.]
MGIEQLEDEVVRHAGSNLRELANSYARTQPGSASEQRVMAEFLFRQTGAQLAAAHATIETAYSTRQSAGSLFWSVIALVVFAAVCVVFTALTYFHMSQP